MAPETGMDANKGWVKCADHVWRRPDDYPGLRLPVPPLAVQPVLGNLPEGPPYAPGPYAESKEATDRE
jgi:hypothetical protein